MKTSMMIALGAMLVSSPLLAQDMKTELRKGVTY